MRSRVFGRVGLCMCVCMYMWTKKRAVWGLTTRKSFVSVIYCLLVEFNGQKGVYYARRFVLRKKFGAILLTGWKKGPGNCIMVGNAAITMQLCECRMPTYNRSCADLQYHYRCSLYCQCLEYTGYVFCGTLV